MGVDVFVQNIRVSRGVTSLLVAAISDIVTFPCLALMDSRFWRGIGRCFPVLYLRRAAPSSSNMRRPLSYLMDVTILAATFGSVY